MMPTAPSVTVETRKATNEKPNGRQKSAPHATWATSGIEVQAVNRR